MHRRLGITLGACSMAVAAVLAVPAQAGTASTTNGNHPAAACVTGGPTVVQIGVQMSSTVEVQNHTVHFTPRINPLTISDGRGTGTLTAIVGVRWPTADGRGQLVFFWHGSHFLGWDSKIESQTAKVRSTAPGSFTVTYNGTQKVHYGFSGTMLISDAAPAAGTANPVRIQRQR